MAKSKNKNGSFSLLGMVFGFIVVGGLGFVAGQASDDVPLLSQVTQKTANEAPAQTAAQQATGEQIEIKPGNPVVAKVAGEDVTRVDVLRFIQTLPPQTRQAPIDQLFPVALEQVINNRVITKQTAGVNLDSDERVQEQLDIAKQNIVREVYVQKQIEEKLTEERLQTAYNQYTANFPEVQEARARHILVKDKALAKDLIAQLNNGGDFAAMAQQHSEDSNAEKGGDIGYFTKNEVVPAFGEAAFAAEAGQVLDQPIETEFGFHVVEVLEKRQRPPASFEDAKPFLEAQLRQFLLNETIQEWKNAAQVQRFDINGQPVGAGIPHQHEDGSVHSHDEG